MVSRGKQCPVCGERTFRERMPWYLRPARKLLRGVSYRSCEHQHWKGLARGEE